MSHWVFAASDGRFVGTRKNNGNMYESRPALADVLGDARIFNTKAAATRAGTACNARGEALPVDVVLEPRPAESASARLPHGNSGTTPK